MLVDLVVIVAIAVLFLMGSDLTIFNAALDPLLIGLYGRLAWLGVFGAILAVWAATTFWRKASAADGRASTTL